MTVEVTKVCSFQVLMVIFYFLLSQECAYLSVNKFCRSLHFLLRSRNHQVSLPHSLHLLSTVPTKSEFCDLVPSRVYDGETDPTLILFNNET